MLFSRQIKAQMLVTKCLQIVWCKRGVGAEAPMRKSVAALGIFLLAGICAVADKYDLHNKSLTFCGVLYHASDTIATSARKAPA